MTFFFCKDDRVTTTLQFFKRKELFASEFLQTVQNGEEAYGVAVNNLAAYFNDLINNIDLNIKDIIGGYHRGYDPMAVADYLITHEYLGTGFAFITGDSNSSQVNEFAKKLLNGAMYSLMGYDKFHWGQAYSYTPSLEERSRDAIDVQMEINNRSSDVAKEIGIENYVRFGTYASDCGSVSKLDKVDKLKDYRALVLVALTSRRDYFLVQE